MRHCFIRLATDSRVTKLKNPGPNISSDLRRTAIAIILVHLAVNIVHGVSHSIADVQLNSFGKIYVLVVIMLAPLVAGALLYKRLQWGAWIMTLSMFGALCFGVLYHFVWAGNDNVMEVHGPGHVVFTVSAIVIAVIELAGTLFGIRLLSVSRS